MVIGFVALLGALYYAVCREERHLQEVAAKACTRKPLP